MQNDFWSDFTNQLTPQMWQLVGINTAETLYICIVATLLAVLVGLPFGVLTFLTQNGQTLENLN